MSKPLIELATAEDVTGLMSVDTEAFDGPLSAAMFPRTPNVEQWRQKKLLEQINDPNAVVLKIMGDNGEIAAFARWSKPKTDGDAKEEDENDGPSDGDHELRKRFFKAMGERRTQNMGDTPHWYLIILATRPSYQGRGYGGLLLQWGLDKADEEKTDAYLEASKAGIGLYKKKGFVEMGNIDVDVPTGDNSTEQIRIVCMLRKLRQATTER